MRIISRKVNNNQTNLSKIRADKAKEIKQKLFLASHRSSEKFCVIIGLIGLNTDKNNFGLNDQIR